MNPNHFSRLNRRDFLNAAAVNVGAAGLLSGAFHRLSAADIIALKPVIAETTNGRVSGYIDGSVRTFKGIPYGAPTSGAARFLPPQKPKPWAGVLNTRDLPPRCPQLPGGLVPEYDAMEYHGPLSEDCLGLNVWTQGIKDNVKRPVMVYFHGGGVVAGSSGDALYDGHNLAAKHDVVMVSINHRLNIFGWLYLQEIGGAKWAEAGNAGIRDMVLALEWVRDNIATFGGNPNNVTIFGQSGGGTKVSTLLGTAPAKGLFHRAIAQSGSNVKGVTKSEAGQSALLVIAKLGLRPDQLDELQNIPYQRFLDVMSAPRQQGEPPLRMAPVVDGKIIPADPFDPRASELSADIPFMVGSTETEVTWNRNQNYDPLDDAGLRARVKQTLRTDDASANRIIAVYKKNRPKASNLDIYLILATDASNFRTGTDIEAERKAAQAKAAVYKYYFQWYSPVRGGALRAMHTMELPFVFDNVAVSKTEVGTGADLQPLADKMSAAWVAFARTGNPNHKGLPNWPAYTTDKRATMIFNNTCTLANDPFREEKSAVESAVKA
ncbi:MAG: carboxylesterase family protein [Bryobacteraceae bacterium]